MSPFVVTLVLASAMLHPIWNMLLKADPNPRLSFIFLTVTMSLFGLFHSLVIGADLVPPQEVVPFMAMSIAGQIIYGTCLTATLQRGDLSVYYPIIRASPVFVVLAGIIFLGRSYEAITLAGIAMVVGGGFLLLYRRGSNLLQDQGTLGLAILAMSGTGIYSMADEQTMQVIVPSVQMFWIEGMLTPYFIIAYLVGRRAGQSGEPRKLTLGRLGFLAIPGALAYTSYLMILHAYKLGGEVAAVTSVRQASIPLSVLLAGYFLNEGSILRRLLASLTLASGIVVVALTG